MYYCNCNAAVKAKGLKPTAFARQLGFGQFIPVQTTRTGECVHCDHTAYFSKVDPNTDSQKRAKICDAEAV